MSWLLNPFKLQCSKDYKHSSVPKRNFDNGFRVAMGSGPFCLFETYEHFRVKRHLIKHWKVKNKSQNKKTPEDDLNDQKLSLFSILPPICHQAPPCWAIFFNSSWALSSWMGDWAGLGTNLHCIAVRANHAATMSPVKSFDPRNGNTSSLWSSCSSSLLACRLLCVSPFLRICQAPPAQLVMREPPISN